jgi:hypothetical protein
MDPRAGGGGRYLFEADGHGLAFGGVFDGVVEEVDQGLLEGAAVHGEFNGMFAGERARPGRSTVRGRKILGKFLPTFPVV